MKKINVILISAVILTLSACKEDPTSDLNDGIYAVFDTNYGVFAAELNYKEAPMTVANFISLADGTNTLVSEEYRGKKYFDGLKFHRVVKDFVIQGGDPQGTGQGGPGYEFPNETDTGLNHNDKGVLSMANAGPDTNGSQFFITLAPTPQLDGGYSVFGKVVKGQDVVDTIGQVETIGEKPKEEVVMNTVKIIRKGSEAKKFDAAQVLVDQIETDKKEKEAYRQQLEDDLNNTNGDFTETDSGLLYKIIAETENETPKRGQTVQVYYKGMLDSGKVFDQKLEKDGQPISFEVGTGRVIPGWDEGLLLLKEGEEARFIIPPHLAYGNSGIGPIPPNSTLIFDVKLAKIGK